MRLLSFLPAATEIVAALGLLESLVGVSHECDYPPEVARLPRVTRCPLYEADLSSAEIDRRVRKSLAAGESLYEIDAALVRQLAPDLVLSQALCDVCAVGYGSVARLLATLPEAPVLLNLEPRRLADLYENIAAVAAAARVPERAVALNARLHERVTAVERRAAGRPRPRVLFLEWIDPPFGPGHWIPELVALAGGECVADTAGAPSTPLDWEAIASASRMQPAARPEVVVIACCGYAVERARQDLPLLARLPGWADLPAVRAGRVHVFDGSQYFSRPGPRLISSLELLDGVLAPPRADSEEHAPPL